MFIEQEHIGKVVTRTEPFVRTATVYSMDADGINFTDKNGAHWARESDWRVVEPVKKPSERVKELWGDLNMTAYPIGRQIHAILKYLDEQAEEKES
jgi:hypothetical protein